MHDNVSGRSLFAVKANSAETKLFREEVCTHTDTQTHTILAAGQGALEQSGVVSLIYIRAHTCNGGWRESGMGFSAKWQMWRQAVQSGRNTQRLLQPKTWSDIYWGRGAKCLKYSLTHNHMSSTYTRNIWKHNNITGKQDATSITNKAFYVTKEHLSINTNSCDSIIAIFSILNETKYWHSMGLAVAKCHTTERGAQKRGWQADTRWRHVMFAAAWVRVHSCLARFYILPCGLNRLKKKSSHLYRMLLK